MRMLCLLLAVAAACGKGKDAPAPPPAPGSGSAVGSGSGAGAGPAAPTARGKDFVALLTAKHGPALVGPFAPIHVDKDLTVAEARDLAPDLVIDANVIEKTHWFEYTAEAYQGVRLRTERFGSPDSDPANWLVGRLRAVFDDRAIKDALVTAWGPPRAYGARSYWYDPAAKLRCVLWPSDGRDTPVGSTVLDCDGYVPLAEVIGTDKVLFGFEGGKPLLGISGDALRDRFGRRAWFGGRDVMMRPTELAERFTNVRTGHENAPTTVTWFVLMISADQKTIEPLLEAKFGKPTDNEEFGKIYRMKQPRIALKGSEIIVGVEPAE